MECPDGCGLEKPEISGFEMEDNMPKTHIQTPLTLTKDNEVLDGNKTIIISQEWTVLDRHDLAFIVRAVNSHEALIETMKDLVSKSNAYRCSHIRELQLLASIIKAEETIAQAEGK